MREKGIIHWSVATLLVTFVAVNSVSAGFWEWSTPYQGPRKDIVTLVLTSNYTKPRLLADLIQTETRQPYILLPAAKNKRIFFVPAKGEALEIRKDQLTRFIQFINPKQVMVLGNTKYVSQKYLDLIDKKQTVWIVNNEDWHQASQSVGRLLDLSNLPYDYEKLIVRLNSGRLYKPDENAAPVVDTKDIPKSEPEVEADVDADNVTIVEEETSVVIEDPEASKLEKSDAANDPKIVTPKDEPVLIKE